jgi:protein-histidine pros-kinase
MGLAGDLLARRKDGSEFPVEVTLSPLETDEGLLISAAVRDISERRRMQQEADRVKDEFFATVSHELRTPLTSMIGYCELMSDLEDLTPQGQRVLSVIMRSAERERRLVDDLLTLVAIEESGLEIRSAEVDLDRVVREAVEAARPRAEERRLSLSVETPGVAVPLHGDRDRLGQAMDNLLSNAIKFTPADGRVRVVLDTADNLARVDVIDTGVGIGEQDPDQIFERLFRAPTAVALHTPGAGLGLTIARAIVEAHAGTIEVVSSGRSGTTLRMSFALLARTRRC